MSSTAAPAPWTPQLGVGPDGHLPLPWLAGPLDTALHLRGAHALLLHGPAGAGHLELAGLLAQSWLCERGAAVASRALNTAPANACGQCASCHQVLQRGHPDLLLLLPDAQRVQWGWLGDDEQRLTRSEAKPSRELRVAQVRDAIAWGQQSSSRGGAKVLVVHPADALNAAAANALLKTLEEPPGGLRLVLTSADPERLLPTVRSRCQRAAVPLPSAEAAANWLAGRGLADARALLRIAGGSPLEALAWAAEGATPDWLDALPRRVAAGEAAALTGRAVPRVVDLLLKLAHDAQVQLHGGAPRFFGADTLPAGADARALDAWQRRVLRVARHDEHPWNAGLLVESLVGQAAAVWPAPGGRRGAAPPATPTAGRLPAGRAAHGYTSAP